MPQRVPANLQQSTPVPETGGLTPCHCPSRLGQHRAIPVWRPLGFPPCPMEVEAGAFTPISTFSQENLPPRMRQFQTSLTVFFLRPPCPSTVKQKVQARTCVHMSGWPCTGTSVHMWTHACPCVHMYVGVHTCVCTCVHRCVRVGVMCVCA